ncbi:hypothetical protein ACH4MN_14655 [Streptomyces anulatus]|uniref:hypothetical protein n=1 Tax=Streptomyces TaxID=1883 RepID=UPI001B380BB1|nr:MULTISPECIES: hypothetical protein [unclassified Streptomyces]MBQ1105613.1 hypothetical protein [Streptomyces sp. 404i]MBQ1115648.1 hypothetical protein [Streptomyces sp. C3-3]
MRENWRSKLSVLAGASALALSAVTATPALAEDAPVSPQEVQMPADVKIVEGGATDPGATVPFPADEAEQAGPMETATPGGQAEAVGAANATPSSSTCLGSTAAYGVSGCFQHNGDIVWAGDTKKDGMSAAVGVYTDYGRAEEVCVNKLGADTWATCNKDYREGGDVRLRVLRYDGDTGKFYQPETWSGWIPVDGKY